MKRYFNEILKLKGTKNELTKDQIKNIPVIGIKPYEAKLDNLKGIEFTKNDIILDLPKPNKEIYFWCDHHSSNKPDKDNPPTHDHHFQIAPSNTGLLIELAIKGGAKNTKGLEQFKECIDIVDDARYNIEQIKNCYYLKDKWDIDNSTPLLKTHILSSFIRSKDFFLTQQFLNFVSNSAITSESPSPLTSKLLWQLEPLQWHIARLKGHNEWREQFDEYVYLDKPTMTVIQDTRKIKRSKGIFDRFYQYLKYEDAVYNLVIKVDDIENTTRLGLGANIFKKNLRKLDVGKTLKTLANKFGEGAGGGHAAVGGATINKEHTDKAIDFILDSIKEAHR